MGSGAVTFLTIVNLLNYLDRYLVAAVLPLVSAELGLNNTQSARLVSGFVFGYFIFSPIFGYLGDRYSRPKLMAFGVAVWSLATISTGLAGTFTGFLLARLMVGIGEASYGTITPGYIKDRIPDPIALNRILSFFFAAISVGAALGYVVAGFVAKHYSWQAVFLVGGVPGLLLSPFLLRFRESSQRQISHAPLLPSLKEIARLKVLWFAVGGYVFNSFALNGIAAFISKYGVSIGFQLEEVNAYFGAILAFTGLVGTVVGGQLSAHFASKAVSPIVSMFRFLAVTALFGVPFLIVAFSVHDHTIFLGACFFAELFIFAGVAPVNAIIVTACPPALVTLTQGATIFCLNFFGAMLAPLYVGIIADTVSLQFAMESLSVVLLLSAIAWWFGDRAVLSDS